MLIMRFIFWSLHEFSDLAYGKSNYINKSVDKILDNNYNLNIVILTIFIYLFVNKSLRKG
jgi:hypothetical protein